MTPVSSNNNIADIFTKPLAGPTFKSNIDRIGVANKPSSLN